LRCHGDGGDPATEDVARVVWRLAPEGRERQELRRDESAWQLRYGSLDVELTRLAEKGGFVFEEAQPNASPGLMRVAPWATGDFVHVATDIHPQGSDGTVHFKPLREGAAALLLEPGNRKACLWVASLVRHWRQHELKVPPGATVKLFKRDVAMPPVPPKSEAYCSLHGGESAVWVIDSPDPLDPAALLDGLRSGWGRGESRPKRP